MNLVTYLCPNLYKNIIYIFILFITYYYIFIFIYLYIYITICLYLIYMLDIYIFICLYIYILRCIYAQYICVCVYIYILRYIYIYQDLISWDIWDIYISRKTFPTPNYSISTFSISNLTSVIVNFRNSEVPSILSFKEN